MPPILTGLSVRSSASALLDAWVAAARSPANRHNFTRTSFEAAAAVARRIDSLRAAGATVPALGGLAVSVKDLFDVLGEVTAAGSTVLAQRDPASADCPLARLRRAGAAFIARTNMSEFAFSGDDRFRRHAEPDRAMCRRPDRAAARRRRSVLFDQLTAAAQPVGREPARWLCAFPFLPRPATRPTRCRSG